MSSSFAALDRPELSIKEAVVLAETYVLNKEENGTQYYVQSATCAYHGKSKKRSWLIGFAQPGGAYYFVQVYMDKSVVGGVGKDGQT
jgi:hypothetical protein